MNNLDDIERCSNTTDMFSNDNMNKLDIKVIILKIKNREIKLHDMHDKWMNILKYDYLYGYQGKNWNVFFSESMDEGLFPHLHKFEIPCWMIRLGSMDKYIILDYKLLDLLATKDWLGLDWSVPDDEFVCNHFEETEGWFDYL